jgi:hypothetical protein
MKGHLLFKDTLAATTMICVYHGTVKLNKISEIVLVRKKIEKEDL